MHKVRLFILKIFISNSYFTVSSKNKLQRVKWFNITIVIISTEYKLEYISDIYRKITFSFSK